MLTRPLLGDFLIHDGRLKRIKYGVPETPETGALFQSFWAMDEELIMIRLNAIPNSLPNQLGITHFPVFRH